MRPRETVKRISPGAVLLSLSLVALSAAQSFDAEEVRELVASGRLNESGDLLQEFLFNATADGDVDILQVLIDFWPDGLHITRGSGETLAHVASFSGQLDALKFLLLRTPEALKAKTEPGLTLWHMAAVNDPQIRAPVFA
ncbi:unnamed protein product [Symbiodinium natans]|uniref:Ankyrin repeat domain-containing protein n=1 Tax=Symbiodinium natans TaxID=878477 RepID=A0A812QXQ5_9DINO|nr:unnamed protein product [Symbiodinium natans]